MSDERTMVDEYGYDRHEISRSYTVPTAIAVFLAGLAASTYLTLLPPSQGADEQVLAQGLDKLVKLMSKDLLDLSFSQSHVLASLVLVSAAIVSLVLARYAGRDNKEFMSAYPYIDDFYTETEKSTIRKQGRAFALASLPFLAVAIALAVWSVLDESIVLRGSALLALAVGAWLLVHGIRWAKRVDIFAYNYRALDLISVYELQADKDFPDRDIMIAEKKLRAPIQTAKRTVIVAGVIVALALYSLPSIETPFYWMAVVIALLISSCLSIYSESRAKKLVEQRADQPLEKD